MWLGNVRGAEAPRPKGRGACALVGDILNIARTRFERKA